ncbi:GGDEF domain-containing protein [Chitinilyticum aquatile]|uniref:GGDEF domain-containing protein n=1 Tax=Chitinilyticum aquatile TaxID=362520 RepID=UPI0003FCB6B1|nr:GGDEF domain-containing protein [Chitinilyticum aquatile]
MLTITPAPSSRPLTSAVNVIIVLLLVTLISLPVYEVLMIKTLVINQEQGYSSKAIDDRIQGGNTSSSIRVTPEGSVLDCELRPKFEWPYCETGITLGENGKGINLEDYDRIRIKLGYVAPPGDTVRVYLRNFNPAYVPGKPAESLKVNQIEYDPRRYPEGLDVSLRYFQVATWWLNDQQIPLELSQPEFDNVTAIEIATGGNAKPGPYQITVHSIEFEGRWLARSTFYALLIGLWVSAALIFLLRRLLAHLQNERQLRELNHSLVFEGEAYRNLARTDTLTGALNRTGAADLLFSLRKETEDSGTGFSMVFFDIDHFKQVNDQYGHQIGDAVLITLVQLVQQHIRNSDALIRWGGEEFLLLLPHTGQDQAMQLAEKLREVVLLHEWPARIKLSCSFGVAEFGEETLSDCLERADTALYAAKHGGRNCVRLAKAPGEQQ